MVLHEDSFWGRSKRQFGCGLLRFAVKGAYLIRTIVYLPLAASLPGIVITVIKIKVAANIVH